MARAFISHGVSSYEHWRANFDSRVPKLDDLGVSVIAVLRDTDNPLSVWICVDSDRAVGEAILNNPEIEQFIRESGGLPPITVSWVA